MTINLLRTPGKSADAVFNIAHRGARAYAPENTLPAFEKAKQFNCEMFEIDVHRAKDGELIVHHDDQLTRCTDVEKKFPGRSSYYVSDFTGDELSTLDAGSWYVEQLSQPALQRQAFLQVLTDNELEQYVSRQDRDYYASGEIRLPTLKQTLELAQKLSLMVNIEIKTLPRMYPGIADAIVNLVVTLTMADRVLISSFDHAQLVTVRHISKTIATAVLTSDRLVDPAAYLNFMDADAFHPGLDSLGFNSVERKPDCRVIKDVRESGRAVNVWTCNDKTAMRQLIAAGVTGLITDYPDRVRAILAE